VVRLHDQLDAMDASLAANDFEGLSALGHWLKGSGGMVGYDDFGEPAARLEQAAKQGEHSEIEACLRELRALERRLEGPDAGRAEPTPRQVPEQREAPPQEPDQRSHEAGPVVSRMAADPRFQPIITKFVVRLHDQLDAMDASLAANDFEGLSALGHWLKGSGGMVGYDDFGEPAARLEQAAKEGKRREIEACLQELRALEDRLEVPGREGG